MIDESTMEESPRLERINIQTSKKKIINPPITKAYAPPVDSANVYDILKTSSSAFIDEFQIREVATEPDERLQFATDLARQQINHLREEVQLDKIPDDKLIVYYVDDEKLSAKKGPSSSEYWGFSPDIGDYVVVKRDHFPDIILGSLAVHELVHKHLELVVSIFDSESDDHPDIQKIYYEHRRNGLSISSNQGYKGMLLNELGNFIYQSQYLSDRIKSNEPELQEELAFRSERLKDYFSNPTQEFGLINIVTSDRVVRVVIHKDKYHFDTNGNLILEKTPDMFAMMQLVEDLATLCGDIDGEPFKKVLLHAKVDPKQQIKLQRALDTKFGQGFFSRLKRASYNNGKDYLDLLLEVQSKLYSIKE